MPRRLALGLAALAVLGLVVRWGWVLGADPEVPRIGDAAAYHLLAGDIADGDGYLRPFDRALFGVDRATAEYPPLHPAVVGAVAAAGVDSVTGQRLWLSVFGAASVAVTGALAWRLARRPAAALAAGAAAAVHPLWFQADATLMPETLAALLGGLTVLASLAAAQRPSPSRWAAAGAACGLAALTRGEALLLLPAVVLPAAVLAARSWRAAGAALAAFGVVVAPWVVRNEITFDEPVGIATNLGSVIDGANCPATYGGDLLGYWVFGEGSGCFEGFLQTELERDDESVVAAGHRRQGVDFALDHAGDWPKVALARLGRTVALFRPGQLADLGALEGREQAADLAGYAMVWVTLAGSVAGAARLRRAGPAAWWVAPAAVLAIWGSTAVTYGNPRFLAAAQPALVALAATGAVRR